MKEFDEIPSAILKPEIGIVENKKTEYRLVASMRRRKGQTLFAFNPESGELRKVDIQQEKIVGIDGRPVIRSRVTDYNPKEVYFFALNFPNAIRKLQKLGIKEIKI